MAIFSNRSWPVYSLIISVALVIVSGGATHEYSQAFLLLLTGGLLVCFPVRKLPERRIMFVLFGLLLWMLISTWLPFPFHTAADWMANKRPDLSAGEGISAQPLLSSEKIIFFFVGLVWLLMLIQRPMNHYRRLSVMQWVVWTVAILALITVYCGVMKIQHPFTWGTHRFSFFPNHNQSGAVFALGGILTFGFMVRAMKKREWEMIAYIAAMAAISLALMLGMSRSSIIVMLGGCLIYFLLTIERKNFRFYLKLGIPVALVFIASFALYGGKLLDEFVGLLSTGGVGEEIRVHIWVDASRMALTFPIFGVGLGNFRYFFPYFMNSASTPQSIFHPESDFLWVWTELGLVGLLLVVVGVVLLLARLDLKDLYRSKGIRLTGFVAICMFLLASLIEVSGHRLGTAMIALLVYGLIQPEHAKLYTIGFLSWVSRVVGALFLLLGGVWIFFMATHRPITSSEVLDLSREDLTEIYNTVPEDSIETIIDNWLRRYPMAASLHNLKGIQAVTAGNTARAIEGFDAAHALNPVWWKPYINHGIYIYRLDFDTALRYWRSGLQLAGDRNIEAFKFVADRLPPERIAELRDLTFGDRDLQFFYFAKLRNMSVDFSKELGLELAINPELNGFSSEQKQALLWRFSQINGPMMLQRLLDRYPSLGTENWSIRSVVRAGQGMFKDASRLAVMNYPEPEMIDLTKSRTLTAIRTDYLLDSTDPLKVIALVQQQKAIGNYNDAMITLEVSRGKGVKHPYLDYQLALVYFHLGKYEEAWKKFETIINNSIDWRMLEDQP